MKKILDTLSLEAQEIMLELAFQYGNDANGNNPNDNILGKDLRTYIIENFQKYVIETNNIKISKLLQEYKKYRCLENGEWDDCPQTVSEKNIQKTHYDEKKARQIGYSGNISDGKLALRNLSNNRTKQGTKCILYKINELLNIVVNKMGVKTFNDIFELSPSYLDNNDKFKEIYETLQKLTTEDKLAEYFNNKLKETPKEEINKLFSNNPTNTYTLDEKKVIYFLAQTGKEFLCSLIQQWFSNNQILQQI